MSCHLFGSLLSLISHVSRCFQSQLGPGDWPWLPGRASATGGDGTAVVHRRQGSPAAGRMYPARWISRNMSFHFVQTVLYYIYIYYIEHCEESCKCPNHHTLKRFRGLTSSMLVSFLSLGLKRRQVGCRVPKNVARFQGLFREVAGAVRCSGNQDKTDARSA